MQENNTCSFTLNEKHNEKEELTSANENVHHLKRNTPILFSTNRGLHLRMTTTTGSPNKASLTSTNNITKRSSDYTMIFCDLERWSTNRANTISLEDTFTVPKSDIVSSSRTSNSLRFLPQMSTSVRFNGYARFDID